MKVHAAIGTPCGQLFRGFTSVGLDVLGVLGIPVASKISLAKDCFVCIVRLCSGKGFDKSNLFAIVHDVSGFLPIYG